MSIQVFAWDYVAKKFVVFPHIDLVTLSDGTRGIVAHSCSDLLTFAYGKGAKPLLARFPDNFKRSDNCEWMQVYKYIPTSARNRKKQLKTAMKHVAKAKRRKK